MTIRVGDHILCPRLGNGEFIVVGEDDRHYKVRAVGSNTVESIYKALCFRGDIKMARENQARRVERANQIGRNKK